MKSIGAIIGRFQVAELHAGHKHLIDSALRENDVVVILLGSKHANATKRNPLSFEERRDMIRETYPHVFIYPLYDNASDETWSRSVDEILLREFPLGKIRLYGSRDSFAKSYSGTLPVVLVPEISGISGTRMREEKLVVTSSVSFRQGLIEAQMTRFPVSYQTVDIGLIDWQKKNILLGRKSTDPIGTWQLFGGFVDPTDSSLEAAASRELREEAGYIITDTFTYLGSFRIEDIRYRGECDQILTALFITYYMGGMPKAADDIEEVKWFPLSEAPLVISKQHEGLLKKVLSSVSNEAR